MRSETMHPSIWRLCVLGPTRERRLPDKVIIADTMKLLGNSWVREGHHQRGSASRREIFHGGWSVEHDQRSSIPSTRRRRRSRVRYRDEQGISDVRFVHTHGIFRPAVRQVAHTAVLLRLRRHIPGRTTVRVLRDGYGQGLFFLAGDSVDDLVTPELREHYFRHRAE